MDYGLYRSEEPYTRPLRRRINYFAWTIAILLLTGAAFAAWLGSFYIFDQPERPESYRILQKLHKIDPPKRFELRSEEHTSELQSHLNLVCRLLLEKKKKQEHGRAAGVQNVAVRVRFLRTKSDSCHDTH